MKNKIGRLGNSVGKVLSGENRDNSSIPKGLNEGERRGLHGENRITFRNREI